MDLDQYLTSDATTLAGLVAAKEVTASELLALARQRSYAVNPTINAVVMPLTRVADARAADPGLTGPFAGVPFLIKDLGQEYAGFPTSSGSRALSHDVATEHSLVTRRFLEAGLVSSARPTPRSSGPRATPSPPCGGRPATRGTSPAHPGARRAGPARRSLPASCRRPVPTTVVARSGSRPPATVWSA